MSDLMPNQILQAQALVSGPPITPMTRRQIGNHLIRSGLHHIFEVVPRSGNEPTVEADFFGLQMIRTGLNILDSGQLPPVESPELHAIRAVLDQVSTELGQLQATLSSAESLLAHLSHSDA